MTSALPYLALTMGLMSSFHCIGMCGPIAMAIPVQGGSKFKRFTGVFVYNSGRAIMYAALGLFLGGLGSSIVFIGYFRYLSILSGILMLAYVLWPHRLDRYFHPPQFWKNLVQLIKNQMSSLLRSRSLASTFLLGVFNGLLPCGLVYLALITSIATGSPTYGALFMLVFGIGTMPVMLAVGFFKQWLSISLRTKMRKLMPVILSIAGIILIVRGLLIQYPSSIDNNQETITVCHGK
ncbi:sulfite exporter TauE/SafE family protein [Dyadobacter sp. LHD-138]|uniref:sulfite exporter TauE/SafE family protein n=1 Tax=Dyadobacter sp. LHD-138 TaxID=3071413 RepID=UPI0027DEBD5F|nr:sulfite exporter TauE/SafE family protein [Dyadobacter sp. LHD-138]MDQ6477495.1 sulfite exporter TauE/SafE family protein [Dyadobacter sp. LHD-138]